MSIDHEQRRKSLGASEVAAILGCNDNMSPLDVWMVKTGRKEAFEGNEHTRRGNRQERQILDWLQDDMDGFLVEPQSKAFFIENSIASATPDGLVWDDSNAELVACCEAKSTLVRIKSIEDLNPSHLIQCQWQMLCTGLKKCHLAIFGPMVSDYQRFEIEYNHDFAMDLLHKATEWWERHVVGNVMPDPINTADALAIWPKDDGSSIEAVPALYEAIGRYKELGQTISELQKQRDELKDRITPAIGAAQVVTYAGQKIASWKFQTANYKAQPARVVESRVLRV